MTGGEIGEIFVLEEPAMIHRRERRVSLGLPLGESRFPLTPEGAVQLVGEGVDVMMEPGASRAIHYTDAAYERVGVRLVPRAEVLRADIVATLSPPSAGDAAMMRRGALLLTLGTALLGRPKSAMSLLRHGVNVVAVEEITDGTHRIVADILHEIDGCASMALASALLADPINGKGILLGGVTGIVACEVCIVGSGMGAIAAAHNARGMGATVRMFDNDLYSLRSASRVLGHETIASSMHPKVLRAALASADVVVITPTRQPMRGYDAGALKARALVFDLTSTPGMAFPSLPLIDLNGVTMPVARERVAYYNVGCRVPRTAAMALSNALVANFQLIADCHGSLPQMPRQLRNALWLYWGKCVEPQLASELGVALYDINLFGG